MTDTGLLGSVALVVLGALVAWRWWLAHLAAQRHHEATVRDARVESLPAMEERIKTLEFRLAGRK